MSSGTPPRRLPTPAPRHRHGLAAGARALALAALCLCAGCLRDGKLRDSGSARGDTANTSADTGIVVPPPGDPPQEQPPVAVDQPPVDWQTSPPAQDTAGPLDEDEIPDSPALKPTFDGKNFVLLTAMSYRIGSTRDSIVVPAGFVTDLASVPPRLHSFVTPLDRNMLPAIVHDYLYWTRGCSKPEADRIFSLAMRETGVSPGARRVIMAGLGTRESQKAYAQNLQDRNAGYIRVLPPAYRNIPRATTWPQYRSLLKGQGVRGDPEPRAPSRFCAWGRSTTLPPGVP